MRYNAVLLSIKPEWCGLIANLKKTVEVRKTKPKLETPFKCYIYCTNGAPYLNRHNGYLYLEAKNILGGRGYGIYERLSGKVIGEFICDGITKHRADTMVQAYYNNPVETCLSDVEIKRYANGRVLYYWNIASLVIYDKPKELSEFGLKRPPQSWCYVKEVTK